MFASGGLLSDLYELTMAEAYWCSGVEATQAVFQLFFRRPPFGSPYVVACGLAQAVDCLQRFTFEEPALDFLGTLDGNDGRPLFCRDFLQALRSFRFACDLDAIPEGTLVFAGEPILRVCGPVWQCQVVESALLNAINFESLVATKAARICTAAAGDRVVEFGMRRAHGQSGAVQASRAAFVGGCDGTSNLLAGYTFGIPVSGTQAHSWIMFFGSELEAFTTYAAAMPNNCIFLVDTYESLSGVRHAVEVAKELRSRGHEMIGVRLDSGDIAVLSRAARELLDSSGFPDAFIVASGDLDEHRILDLKKSGARVDVWGVGSKLVTGHEEAFLGGVYKLSAVRSANSSWVYKIKLSEQKSAMPGILQVRRHYDQEGHFAGDTVFDVNQGLTQNAPVGNGIELLAPVLRNGQLVQTLASVHEARQRCERQLQQLSPKMRSLENPVFYEPWVDLQLQQLRSELMDAARQTLRKESHECLGGR